MSVPEQEVRDLVSKTISETYASVNSLLKTKGSSKSRKRAKNASIARSFSINLENAKKISDSDALEFLQVVKEENGDAAAIARRLDTSEENICAITPIIMRGWGRKYSVPISFNTHASRAASRKCCAKLGIPSDLSLDDLAKSRYDALQWDFFEQESFRTDDKQKYDDERRKSERNDYPFATLVRLSLGKLKRRKPVKKSLEMEGLGIRARPSYQRQLGEQVEDSAWRDAVTESNLNKQSAEDLYMTDPKEFSFFDFQKEKGEDMATVCDAIDDRFVLSHATMKDEVWS